jgi:hypothetical protein
MSQLYQRSPNVLFAELGTDVIALEVNLGQTFGMEGGSAAIWKLLAAPISVEQMVARLTETYDVAASACRADVERIVGELERECLVSRVSPE